MRIIHTSDWHLGQFFYGKSRSHEHKQFLTWLLNEVTVNNVDAVIVAGDIFDTGSPPSYARELYFNFITDLHKLNCQLVILAGNHDSVAMIAESKQLLRSLTTVVVPAASIDEDKIAEQVFTLNNKQGEPAAVICAVPFIRPRDVITSKAGQSATQKQQQLQQAIADHYHALYDRASQLAGEELPTIATGHLTTVGASTSDSVRDIYIGTLDAFPANAFPKADYIALGHIHKTQLVAKSEHIRYCGSPIPLSFDEAKQDKNILMVDFSAGKLTKVTPVIIPRFQPMAMVKTSIDNVIAAVDALIEQTTTPENAEHKLWLDIEVDSGEYRNDLQQKITEQLADKPVEILLIRRSKNARQQSLNAQHNITLDELSVDDVFNARLALETWPEETWSKETLTDNIAKSDAKNDEKIITNNNSETATTEHDRKNRLITLFKQTLADVQAEAKP
jgi:exonuclease SbcD